jgi:hypothetical protein
MEIIGKPGRLVELRKSDIRVPEYQREVDWPRVKRGAAEFDWFLFGVLYISYRPSEAGYYVVDGRHRLEMSRLLPEVDLLPSMLFEFNGPQHEAEVFVKLQRYRKPLVTRDMHSAELIANGAFGDVAKRSQAFVDTLDCDTIPLASIRKLVATKPEAFDRISALVAALVGPAPLAKDFIEAIVFLEDQMGEEDSLADRHAPLLFDAGYEALVLGMLQYNRDNSEGRLAKIASPRLKADALRWALFEGGQHLEPVSANGGDIGALIIPHQARH